MKKLKIVALLLLLTMPLCFQAQVVQLPIEYVQNSLQGENNLPEKVDGSPYVNENFEAGRVSMGDKSFDIKIRYNAFTDAFEIKNNNGEIITLLRRPDIMVSIGNADYAIESYIDDDGQKKQGYFKQLYEGKTAFLLKQGVELKEAKKATSSYGKDKPASLDHYEKYFIKKENTPAVEVRLKRKDILEVLSDKRVKDYVKENDLKLKEEAEVIQVLEFYNALD